MVDDLINAAGWLRTEREMREAFGEDWLREAWETLGEIGDGQTLATFRDALRARARQRRQAQANAHVERLSARLKSGRLQFTRGAKGPDGPNRRRW